MDSPEVVNSLCSFARIALMSTVNQVDQAIAGGNFKSATRHVGRLVELGVLEEVTGQQRNRVFRAGSVVEAMLG